MKSNVYASRAAITLMPEGRNIWNAKLGLLSETGEVAGLLKKKLFQRKQIEVEQLQLELGDVLWYLWLYCDVTGLGFPNIIDSAIADREVALGDVLMNIVDCLSLDDQLSTATGIARCVKNAANILGIEIHELMEQNINKLSARYATKKANAA